MTEMYKALCRKLVLLGQDALSLTQPTPQQKVESVFEAAHISKSLSFDQSEICGTEKLDHSQPEQDLLQKFV